MSSSPDITASTDNELLMQFSRHRDEEAFRELAERHAALVMSVCRHVTRNEQDAEDAFQATLLILARRADRLLHVTSLGGWLHRVAFRTSLRAGGTKQRESRLVEEPVIDEEDALRDIHVRETQRVLHEEMSHIPARYRNAIVLCDLEGKTRHEAAQKLDCTEATVKAALARGRRRLRFRMLKRGSLLSLGMITANKAVAATTLRPELLESTVALCSRQILTSQAGPANSASVQKLAREGAQAMTYSSLMKPFALVSTALVLVVVPLALLGQISARPSPNSEQVVLHQSSADEAAQDGVLQAGNLNASRSSDDENSKTQDGTDARDNSVDELTSELLETLRQLVSISEQRYRDGTTQPEAVFRARNKLLEVQISLADSRVERIRMLTERAENFLELEKVLEGRVSAGTTTPDQFLEVKAERLEAQIAVAREQSLERREGIDQIEDLK